MSFPADINECEDISDKVPLCQNGQCTNTEGSYKCTCLPGFVASAQPHKCIPAIPESGLRKTENWDSDCWSAGLFCSHKDHFIPLCPFPQGPGTKLPTVTPKRPNLFPCIQTQTHTLKHTHSHSAQHILIAPSYRFKRTRVVQWMYYMGFNDHQISICLKGILWTDLFLFSNPGQFDT